MKEKVRKINLRVRSSELRACKNVTFFNINSELEAEGSSKVFICSRISYVVTQKEPPNDVQKRECVAAPIDDFLSTFEGNCYNILSQTPSF